MTASIVSSTRRNSLGSASDDPHHQVDGRGQDRDTEHVGQQAVPQGYRPDLARGHGRVGDLVGHAEVVAEVEEVAEGRSVALLVEIDPALGAVRVVVERVTG